MTMTLRKAIISLVSTLAFTTVWGQSADYDYILDSNPLLQSRNAAALCTTPLKTFSSVKATFTKDNGSYVDINGSDNSLEAGANAWSYTRISDRIVLYGGLSYSYFNGRNMAGSLLRDMDYNPFGFYDNTVETAGVKTKELYNLDGGIGYSFNDSWAMGFKVNYQSGNFVKTKDPRHRSEWMLLDLSASAFWRPSDRISAGASLIFKNTQELVKNHLYGTSDKPYYIFVDRGLFFGSIEQVGNLSGFVSSSDFQPATNLFYGLGLQLESHGKATSYNNLTVLVRSGKYGNDTSTKPLYFSYNGILAEYDGKILTGSNAFRHDIHYNASFSTLNSTEHLFKYNTEAGTNTTVQYTGQRDVLDRMDIGAGIGYKASTKVSNNRPDMQFGADAGALLRTQTATIYPYYRKQTLTRLSVNAFYLKNFCVSTRDIITLRANLLYGMGLGEPVTDGQLATSTGSALKKNDDYLLRQHEYDTAPHAGAGLTLSYTRDFTKRISMFISLSDSYNTLFKTPVYIKGTGHNCAVFTIGCKL